MRHLHATEGKRKPCSSGKRSGAERCATARHAMTQDQDTPLILGARVNGSLFGHDDRGQKFLKAAPAAIPIPALHQNPGPSKGRLGS